MAEVARLAGVSVTTVSHVINGTRPAAASIAATTSVKYGFESPEIARPSDCVPPRASARASVFGR